MTTTVYRLPVAAIMPPRPTSEVDLLDWAQLLHDMIWDQSQQVADRIEHQVLAAELDGAEPADAIEPDGSRRLLVDVSTRTLFIDTPTENGPVWYSVGPECGDITTDFSTGKATIVFSRGYGTVSPQVRPNVQLTVVNSIVEGVVRVFRWDDDGTAYTGCGIALVNLDGDPKFSRVMWNVTERSPS
jgi:hypothetical protein